MSRKNPHSQDLTNYEKASTRKKVIKTENEPNQLLVTNFIEREKNKSYLEIVLDKWPFQEKLLSSENVNVYQKTNDEYRDIYNGNLHLVMKKDDLLFFELSKVLIFRVIILLFRIRCEGKNNF